MIVFKCDRCKKECDDLWRTELHFSKIKIDESPDGEFGKTSAEICESCSDYLDQLLAKECGKPDPLKPKKEK